MLQQIPANFQNDETIVRIKEMTDKQKKTAVGTQFVDFEMQTPEGKTVKLSNYVGKGKVVLVDFWKLAGICCNKASFSSVELL